MPGTPERAYDALAHANSAAWWSLEFARRYQQAQCAHSLSLSSRFRALHRLYVVAAGFEPR